MTKLTALEEQRKAWDLLKQTGNHKHCWPRIMELSKITGEVAQSRVVEQINKVKDKADQMLETFALA